MKHGEDPGLFRHAADLFDRGYYKLPDQFRERMHAGSVIAADGKTLKIF
jgi:hypothetical protein